MTAPPARIHILLSSRRAVLRRRAGYFPKPGYTCPAKASSSRAGAFGSSETRTNPKNSTEPAGCGLPSGGSSHATNAGASGRGFDGSPGAGRFAKGLQRRDVGDHLGGGERVRGALLDRV